VPRRDERTDIDRRPMINVLHLRDTDRVCGPGKTIIETACATDRRQFSQKIGLLLLRSEGENAYQSAAVQRGVDVIPIVSAHQFDPRIVSAIVRVIQEHQIHILHSHEYKSDILAYLVSRIHRVPVMSTVHGWITNGFKSRTYVSVSQKALRRFDRVVAVSEQTRRAVVARGVSPDRTSVIHNGIVVEDYDPARQEPGELRRRFAIPADAPIVGYVGRLSPEKGQKDLLNAVARLGGDYEGLHLVFAGDGPDRAALLAQAEELGLSRRVHMTGHLRDVRPVYRDLDVLALTSHTEGFPNVVLEALCMDRPVLATTVGGVPELLEHQRSGVLVPPRSPEAIADGLRWLLQDPARARDLAAYGKKVVLDRFTFRGRVAKEEALYQELLATWTR
jgi:glycosyltransferase involved in cell wall biosynthesis